MSRSPIPESQLSRRERQIMDVVYAGNEVTARQVLEGVPDPPGYSSIRKMLSLLVKKGALKTRFEGRSLVYRPATPVPNAARSALQKLVDTFFGGSVSQAMSGLLDLDEDSLTPEQLEQLKAIIEQAENSQPS